MGPIKQKDSDNRGFLLHQFKSAMCNAYCKSHYTECGKRCVVKHLDLHTAKDYEIGDMLIYRRVR